MNAPARRRALAVVLACVAGSMLLYFGLRQLSLELGPVSVFGRQWELDDPTALLLVALTPLLLVSATFSLTGLPWQQRLISLVIRGVLLSLLAVGLSRPLVSEQRSRVCAMVLVDVSRSVADAALERFRDELLKLDASKAAEDDLRLIAFGQSARELPLVRSENGQLEAPQLEDLRASVDGGATNIQVALDMAAAFSPSDCLSRYVLFSDGIQTRGDALSALVSDQASSHVSSQGETRRLYVHPFADAPAPDAAVVDVEIAQGVRVGEPFSVRVSLQATRATEGQLRLYQADTLNGLDGVREVKVPGGASSYAFRSVVRVPGDISYRAEFVPHSEDRFSENNVFATSVEVPGPPRVLLVDGRSDQATYLAQALSAQQLDVDVRAPSAFPRTSRELGAFDFLILSDVPYAAFSRGAEQLTEQYVRGGGGLLFAGGEAGFGPGGWDRSLLKRILPVTMDSTKEREIPGVAMALVIDRSGSMTGMPLSMAKEACRATVSVLEDGDLIEVIAFDSRPSRYVKMQPARYASRIGSSIARIAPGGGTEIFSSLDMAYQDLSVVEARRKHIILLTDGNAQSDGIYELAGTAFTEGITITSVGLGTGVNQALLQMIAEAGGGRFHQVDDAQGLPRIFTRETELISKKAQLDDWFPVAVAQQAEFLKGVGMNTAPLLRGYTSTALGPAPSSAVLVSDRGEPILARRPVGLGWTLAWTSDLKARWAMDWLRWSGFGRLMAQLVREHQYQDDTVLRPMQLKVVGDELFATVEAFDEQENFENRLRSQLTLRRHSERASTDDDVTNQSELAAGNQESELSATFAHVGPGLYEARLKLPGPGAYSVKAHHHLVVADRVVPAGMSLGSVSVPYREEFRDLQPREAELSSWAEQFRGVANPRLDEVWSAQGDVLFTKRARHNDFILLAIGLFFLDLLLRRVRLFDRNFKQ